MIELQFDGHNYVAILQQQAERLNLSAKNNVFTVPETYGSGWVWAENLGSGISVIASDTRLAKDITLSRPAMDEQYFALQFTEIHTEKQSVLPLKIDRDGKQVIMLQSYVILSHTLVPTTYVVPAGVQVKNLKFLFNRPQLASLIGEAAADKLIAQCFAPTLVKETPEIIDVEYRGILDELMEQNIKQPLRINYIQNRVLLLLEKFIEKQLVKKDTVVLKAKLGDSEVERLMKAESLLVKDYSSAPPTITKLSKICAMSATKLKNDFKSLYGVPIYEYYQKNRLAKAKAVLLEGNYNIKEVGMMVGYSNLSHFAAAFKKEFGVLPSALLAKDTLMYAM